MESVKVKCRARNLVGTIWLIYWHQEFKRKRLVWAAMNGQAGGIEE